MKTKQSSQPETNQRDMLQSGHQAENLLVELFISTHCAHCAAMLQIMTTMVKQGDIDRLEIINLEKLPEVAVSNGVRSVPVLKIGAQLYEGRLTASEVNEYINRASQADSLQAYFSDNLSHGDIQRVLDTLHKQPDSVKALSALMDDADAKINIRLGIGVIFETIAKTPLMKTALPALQAYLNHQDARVRADACYYLSLTEDRRWLPILEKCLQDENADVREIAQDGIGSIVGASGN